MKTPRGEIRISAVAVLVAVAFAVLVCAGCFDTGAPAVPAHVYQPSPRLEADEKADKDALAAAKRADDDMVKVCPVVISRSIAGCEQVCALFNATKKNAKERMARYGEITLDIMFPERGRDGYKEMVDELSPLCVQEHLKECGVVEIEQSKTLDEDAKADAKLKLVAQIDPACGAAVAFAERKKQDLEDTLAHSRRDIDLDLDAERGTSCIPTSGGGFDCRTY